MVSPVRKAATVVSAVFNPYASATLYFAGLAVTVGAGIWSCLISWCLIVLPPAAMLLRGLRRGILSDPDITRLAERRTFLPWAAVSAAAAAVVATRADFAYPIRLSVLGICLWLLASVLVTLFWKASMHVGALTGIVGLVWVLFGHAAAGPLLALPLVVAWARVYLGKHNFAQVLGGGLLGTLAVVAAVAVAAST